MRHRSSLRRSRAYTAGKYTAVLSFRFRFLQPIHIIPFQSRQLGLFDAESVYFT